MELDDNGTEVDFETSQGEPESTVENPRSSRQPQKINLDDLEEFRKFKSEVQKRETRERQERERIARELEEQRQWRRSVELQGMDEVSRAKYERDEAFRALQAYQQEERRRYEEWQWDQLVQEVHRETGIPVDRLADAENSNDLWRLGRKYEREGGKNRSRDDDDDDEPVSRRVDDRVSLGSDKRVSAEARFRQEIREAKENGDLDRVFEIQDKAYKMGLDLTRR